MRYLLTSPKLTGRIIIEYDDETRCVTRFEFDMPVTLKQARWFFQRFPYHTDGLAHPDIKFAFVVKEAPASLSFNDFWNAYAYKVGNKSRAEKLWNILSEPERAAALLAIRKYDGYLAGRPKMEKAYPETWLNQRRWENHYQ